MAIAERIEKINYFSGDENLSMLLISDIHLWYSKSILDDIEKVIEKNNPDLILMTGDYFDLPRGANIFREFLSKIAKVYKIAFIRGNHDLLYGDRISNLLLGIPNCFNVENAIFKYKSKQGYRYNITAWNNRFSLANLEDEKNIVLIHNPEKIVTNDLENINIILAGHLHGGQFIFFKTKDNSNFPGCLLYKHCTDRKQIGNTTLVVSKGLGDTLPFRLNCPKEVVIIKIN